MAFEAVAEAMADPQIAARRLLARVQDGPGPFLVPNPPFKFADSSVGGSQEGAG